MKKKRIVNEIVGRALEKTRFVYDEEYSDGLAWYFKRQVESIEQMIGIVEHRYAKQLTLRFNTTAWGVSEIDATIFIPADQYHHEYGWWKYEDEDSFRQVLEEFVNIIEEYGMDKLTEMSIEDEIIPTGEMADLLYKSHEDLSKIFIDENNLSIRSVTKEAVLNWFDIIFSKMQETKDVPYDDVKKSLVEMAAFLGDQLRCELGGEWMQVAKGRRAIFLNKLNCYSITCYPLLTNIINAWKNQTINILKQEYILMLDGKLPLEREQMIHLQERWREIHSNPIE